MEHTYKDGYTLIRLNDKTVIIFYDENRWEATGVAPNTILKAGYLSEPVDASWIVVKDDVNDPSSIFGKEAHTAKELEHHLTTTLGLWATDKPELVPKTIKEKYFFEIK